MTGDGLGGQTTEHREGAAEEAAQALTAEAGGGPTEVAEHHEEVAPPPAPEPQEFHPASAEQVATLTALLNGLGERLTGIEKSFADALGGFEQRLEGLETEVEGLADFKEHCAAVVASTAESVVLEALDEGLKREWVPRIEQLLGLVEQYRGEVTGMRGVFAEVQAAIPILRRIRGLESLVARIEAAAAKAGQPVEPRPQIGLGGPAEARTGSMA